MGAPSQCKRVNVLFRSLIQANLHVVLTAPENRSFYINQNQMINKIEISLHF